MAVSARKFMSVCKDIGSTVLVCRNHNRINLIKSKRIAVTWSVFHSYSVHANRQIRSEDAARDFLISLQDDERRFLYDELHKNAQQKESETLEKPTTAQLKRVFIHNALPFVGFGFLDNVLMITSGEYIEMTLGTMMTISTMAAAAMGNMVSDVAGLGTASYVENWAGKIKVNAPQLSPQQRDMKQVKYIKNMAKVIGVAVGCFFGMFPLLFFKNEEKKGDKHASDDKLTAKNSKLNSS